MSPSKEYCLQEIARDTYYQSAWNLMEKTTVGEVVQITLPLRARVDIKQYEYQKQCWKYETTQAYFDSYWDSVSQRLVSQIAVSLRETLEKQRLHEIKTQPLKKLQESITQIVNGMRFLAGSRNTTEIIWGISLMTLGVVDVAVFNQPSAFSRKQMHELRPMAHCILSSFEPDIRSLDFAQDSVGTTFFLINLKRMY